MSKVGVAGLTLSIDGFAAGPDQSSADPLGMNGEDLHPWIFDKQDAVDCDFRERMMRDVGAFIMGRNMFGPVRGAWPDDEWRGWWGDNPPYHLPVFVLTHHPRKSVVMEGGTTFHFVTGGIAATLEAARGVADGKDVRIAGGASTVRQYLDAGLIDELHIAVAPVMLGSGEAPFDGIDLPGLGYRIVERQLSTNAMHVVLQR